MRCKACNSKLTEAEREFNKPTGEPEDMCLFCLGLAVEGAHELEEYLRYISEDELSKGDEDETN